MKLKELKLQHRSILSRIRAGEDVYLGVENARIFNEAVSQLDGVEKASGDLPEGDSAWYEPRTGNVLMLRRTIRGNVHIYRVCHG